MKRANCINRPDIDFFDHDCGLQSALAVCATCPVGDQCLDYAIKNNLTDGIWGGAWGSELAAIVEKAGEVADARYP